MSYNQFFSACVDIAVSCNADSFVVCGFAKDRSGDDLYVDMLVKSVSWNETIVRVRDSGLTCDIDPSDDSFVKVRLFHPDYMPF